MTRFARLASLCLLLAALPAAAQPAFSPQAAFPGSAAAPEFLKVEQAYPVAVKVEGGALAVTWSAQPGYYLYRHAFRFRLDGAPLEVALPPGQPKHDENFGEVQVFYGELPLKLPLPAGRARLDLDSQGCAEAGLCYPPYRRSFEVDPATGEVRDLAPAADVAMPAPAAPPAAAPEAAPEARPLGLMLLFALAGGLILNLMPCVFPLLTVKAVGFARIPAGERLGHSAVYALGVVLGCLGIAGLMLALRAGGAAIGWGFQLQSPAVVGALAYLFLLMGLNLSGVIEVGGRWMGLGSAAAGRPGLSGSLFTGLLAVVVASPCSAPFMGTALGYAVLQSAPVALAIFAALGLGLALPMLLLAAVPGALRWLPRPGHWMVTLRQVLAFPLYASAIWLLWVLGRQTGVDGMATALLGCLLLALAAWSWADRPALNRAGRAIAGGVAVLAAAVALGLLNSPTLQPGERSGRDQSQWEPYTAARLAALREEGRPVFINATADWCITCLANERIALHTPRAEEAFSRGGVALLVADWTRQDPEITALLASHGRSGVPLYLYFPAGAAAPVLLPQLLSAETIERVLAP